MTEGCWSLGDVTVQEQGAAPSNPGTGFHRLYPKSDGWYWLNPAGVEVGPFGVGGGNDVGLGVTLVTSSAATAYATITLALAAASSGDGVYVGPGTYAESFTIPAGVSLVALAGAEVTKISGTGVTGTRVVLSSGSTLSGFEIKLPTDSSGAVTYAGAGLAYVKSCELEGEGSSGIGIIQSGATGALDINDVRYESGTCDALMLCSAGILQATRVLMLGGTATDYARFTGGTAGLASCLVGSSATVTDCVELGAATFLCQNVRFRSGTTALHVTSDSAVCDIVGTVFEASITNHILADGGLSTADILFTAGELRNTRISGPAAWLSGGGLIIQGADRKAGDKRFTVWSELEVGHAEYGNESIFGEGDSYTRGMVVKTTNSTASPSNDGAAFADVSEDAASSTGSTFSFQGTAPGHSILIGSTLATSTDSLKHWGIKSKMSGTPTTGGTFIFEIWDGSAWVEVGAMSTHSSLFHPYSKQHFLRPSTSEHIRYGVINSTAWTKKTIDGDNLYWSRIRITGAPTTAPVFEQFKLHSSRSEKNSDGTDTYHGNSRFRRTIVSTGNVFGETGTVASFTSNVGSGGLPTGWSHAVKNSELDSNGDAIHVQFPIPAGTDTSLAMFIDFVYEIDNDGAGDDADLVCSMKPIEVAGVLVADPSGGVTPTPRTPANTAEYDASAGQADTTSGQNIDTEPNDLLFKTKFGPFDITDFYEGDMIAVRLEMDNDGTPNVNIGVWSVGVTAGAWTHGEKF